MLGRSLHTHRLFVWKLHQSYLATPVSLGIETRFRNCSGVSHYYKPKQHAEYPARTLLWVFYPSTESHREASSFTKCHKTHRGSLTSGPVGLRFHCSDSHRGSDPTLLVSRESKEASPSTKRHNSHRFFLTSKPLWPRFHCNNSH